MRFPLWGLLCGALVAAVVLPLAPPAPAPAHDRVYAFASMPDFLNADIGDTRTSPAWELGMPVGSNAAYEQAIGTVLDDVAARHPRDVLVAGDLVEGRWGMDAERTGVFGPVDTRAHRLQALHRAAEVYYGDWRQRFAVRDLPVHAAVGDHELGDDPWTGPRNAFKRGAQPAFRDAWAEEFTAGGERYRRHLGGTNYATSLHPEVLLVTVDVFRSSDDDVVAQLGPRRLRWLRRTLERAERRSVDWIVVQGHTPVAGPVRSRFSSELRYRGGTSSPFWDTLADAGVDLYLSGEVHDVTVTRDRGVTQVAHGGLFYRGQTTYLTGEVRSDGTMRLEVRGFDDAGAHYARRLWQTDRRNLPGTVAYDAPSQPLGTMVLDREQQVLERTGIMRPFRPAHSARS